MAHFRRDICHFALCRERLRLVQAARRVPESSPCSTSRCSMSPSPPPGSIPWGLFEELLALHPSLVCGVCFVRLAQHRRMMHTLRTNSHPQTHVSLHRRSGSASARSARVVRVCRNGAIPVVICPIISYHAAPSSRMCGV